MQNSRASMHRVADVLSPQRDHQADRPIHLRLRRSGYSARVSLRPCGR